MITFNFNRIFKARGIDKPFSYLVKNGFSGNTATKIVNHRVTQFNLEQVEHFCVLFHCTPNDLLQWIPNSEEENNENHPLYPLRRTDKVNELTRMLNSVPLNKLMDIEELIKKEIEK